MLAGGRTTSGFLPAWTKRQEATSPASGPASTSRGGEKRSDSYRDSVGLRNLRVNLWAGEAGYRFWVHRACRLQDPRP